MSVVIKDMDKPESCESCEFVEGAYYFDEDKKFRGYCHRTGLEIPCECPIIPMLPHGDLIDRSKIHKAIPAEEDNCTGMGMSYDEMDAYNDGIDAMYDLVQKAKPIIEAEPKSCDGCLNKN